MKTCRLASRIHFVLKIRVLTYSLVPGSHLEVNAVVIKQEVLKCIKTGVIMASEIPYFFLA